MAMNWRLDAATVAKVTNVPSGAIFGIVWPPRVFRVQVAGRVEGQAGGAEGPGQERGVEGAHPGGRVLLDEGETGRRLHAHVEVARRVEDQGFGPGVPAR